MNIALKPWTLNEADKEALKKLFNKKELRTYLSNSLPYPYTTEDAEWFINRAIKRDGTRGIYRAIVVDGVYIGNISIEQKDDVYGKSADLGYMMDNAYWSKGIMTGAVRQICDLAFEQLDIVRIEAVVYSPNIGSHRVLEKNGFVLEGIKRKAVFKNQEYYDCYIYSSLKEENY